MDYKYGNDRRNERCDWTGTERRKDTDWRFTALRRIRTANNFKSFAPYLMDGAL
jgi:hypothetical protein